MDKLNYTYGENSLTCNVCRERFVSMQALDAHSCRAVDTPLSCDGCRAKFVSKRQLLTHFLTCVREKPFSCVRCNDSFTTEEILNSHPCPAAEKFVCNVCRKEFIRKAEFETHFCSIGGNLKTGVNLKIPIFNQFAKQYTVEDNLNSSLCPRSATERFICNLCHKGYITKAELEIHFCNTVAKPPILKHVVQKLVAVDNLNSNRFPTVESFMCSVCNNFISKAKFESHLCNIVKFHTFKQVVEKVTVKDNINLPPFPGIDHFICNLCHKEFFTKFQLETHVCITVIKTCNLKRFAKEYNFIGKLKADSCDTVVENVNNNECDDQLNDEENLNADSCHSALKPVTFNECNEQLNVKVNKNAESCKTALKAIMLEESGEHLNVEENLNADICNTGEKHSTLNENDKSLVAVENINFKSEVQSFSCGFCDIKFATELEFRIHQSKHINSKPPFCEVCRAQFTSTEVLDALDRDINERKFSCPVCKILFETDEAVKKHICTHEMFIPTAHGTKKVFVCQPCDEKFVLRRNLEKHIKKKHVIEFCFTCDACRKNISDGKIVKNASIHS